MVQGADLLKGGGGQHFPNLIFSRFIIFTFRNNFFPFAKLCYAFKEKKNYLPPSFYEKRSSCLKMNLKISYKLG